jgi:hypothetical protein
LPWPACRWACSCSSSARPAEPLLDVRLFRNARAAFVDAMSTASAVVAAAAACGAVIAWRFLPVRGVGVSRIRTS